MDSTAPKDPQPTEDNQSASPVQPGQFVVSGEPAAGNQTTPPPMSGAPSSAAPASPNPSELQADLQSTAEAATGTNLAGQPANPPPPPPPSSPPPSGGDPNQQQPDPVPFVPPGSPVSPPDPAVNAPAPSASAQTSEGGGSSSKKKMILIAVGAFVLIVILAAVGVFFILGSNSSERATNNSTNTKIINDPILFPPTSDTGSGFGDIPETEDEILNDPLDNSAL